MRGAADESVSSHRRPCGIGQVGTDFHHDNSVADPVNTEPELIGPHTKGGIARLHHRTPRRGRTTGKGWTPAAVVRQVIDRWPTFIHEYKGTCFRRITQKIDSRQARAARERKVCDVGDAAGDDNASQASAVTERIESDPGDAVGDDNAGQADAAKECTISDVGDAIADRDFGQAGAAIERIASDVGDAIANRDVGQASGAIERRESDSGDAVGDVDTGRAGAALERKVFDAGGCWGWCKSRLWPTDIG